MRRRIDGLNFNGQEKCFQRFTLPEPVLCVGGYLQIQLLGRVQRQEMDDLFYIWFVSSFLSLIERSTQYLLLYLSASCRSGLAMH